ncbi:MAG: enoyl-CoA hydratase/isomerase family protein [Streptosporangiales bacterium]|nr:enoyl-CoA hydratase/isomerase family protein [Streptosporangiales bacterium]MBO0890566.1 enoyl-CoA hydratase/isomerase family protein [Acidothermales bacterium]
MSEDILTEEQDGIAVLTLNRPRSLNAWDMAMEADLAELIRDAARQDRVRGVVLTGSGDRAFCAGQDLAEAARFAPEQIDAWLANFQNLYETVLAVDKPVVAALNGVAAGSGYQLALLCDVRVAHPGVRMGQPEVTSGIPSITGMYLTERALGASRMLELMLTGRLMDVDELTNAGLVHHVVAADEVRDKAIDVARTIANQPTVAVALTKERYRQTVLPGLRDAFAAAAAIDRQAWASGQPQEVMRAFFETRRRRATSSGT